MTAGPTEETLETTPCEWSVEATAVGPVHYGSVASIITVEVFRMYKEEQMEQEDDEPVGDKHGPCGHRMCC